MNIEFKGNSYTNSSPRDGIVPVMIVNHVTSGTGSSAHNWFTSPNNKVASAHFLVWEDGRVTQYVDIKEMAWANGLTTDRIPKAKSSYVRSRPNTNPNKYSISIEHAGYTGELTEAQFNATVALQKYIISEVKRIWGVTIPVNRTHIVGHFEVDPIRKPNCPGPKYPWSRLMKALGGTSSSGNVTVSNSSSTLLKEGMNNDAVKSLQKNLIALGYKLPKYGADGGFGEETKNAVKAFQKAEGLSVDGIVGPATLSAIANKLSKKSTSSSYSTILGKERKNKSSDVKAYQQKLIKAGYKLPKYGADGDFGNETVSATKKFQKDNGLSADGLAGPKTLAKLDSVLKSKSSSKETYVTVKKGDTASELAKKYGSTLAQLKSWNKLDKDYTIVIGKKIRVK